jgi:uncharacterized protein
VRAELTVRRFDNPVEFAAVTQPFLLENEAENCFFIGHIPTLCNPTHVLLFAITDSSGAVVAIALMTPGRHMVMTRASADAAVALGRYLHAARIDPPGIQAPREVVAAFAREWLALTGARARPSAEMGIHQLSRVTPPHRPAAGRMRPVHAADLDLLTRWVVDFGTSIGEAHFSDGRAIAERSIAEGTVVFWEDNGESVAMAGSAGPTPRGIRINLVYTPPEFRNRGYASTLVAALSQQHLDAGRRFCFLYTDLANPTSNKIYRAIGYEPVGESVRVLFDRAPDGR